MLSRKTRYAIHALLHLARNYGSGPVSIATIAEAHNIPKKFLEAILADLRKAGIVSSRKGPGGGYYLHKQPEMVNLAQVTRLFDGPIALLPCVTYKYYERCDTCTDEATCGIRKIIYQLRRQTVELLKKATLAEILNQEHILLNALPDDEEN